MKRVLSTLLFLSVLLTVSAGQVRWGKLSPMLRQMVHKQQLLKTNGHRHAPSSAESQVCAFMRINDDAANVMSDYNCRDLTSIGDIHIVSIPVSQLAPLSVDPRVLRIEARPMGSTQLDTVNNCLNVIPAHFGTRLPQAFTGRGVVVGLMDVGFDLTHPTFYDSTASTYRIRRLWDMLSVDTLESNLYVGRDYVTEQELLTIGHSRDGQDQTHGTHTTGIAAGSGYDSPYRGMAPESDICLVANAVTDNVGLIDSTLLSRFTFATDALGFKYIVDYAREKSQPCVISFSEGSPQDFWGYDQLYYEMIDSLLGPGSIMVSAAGNQGHIKSWFLKPAGSTAPTGTFITHSDDIMMLTLKSADIFNIRLVDYHDDHADTLIVSTTDILACPDSVFSAQWGMVDSVVIESYPNCYDSTETCYDVLFFSEQKQIGTARPLSIEITDNLADVECWRYNGQWITNGRNPALCAGENTHNILSPASAPRIICVGATTHRDSILNYKNEWKRYWTAEKGHLLLPSSVGPTMDGRIKPDVVAPGNNVISAYSSYYLESHPTANDISWDVAHFDFNGRTYAWNSNSGTSMACPAVAGIIALWLQAKPDLTPEEALAVISRTSRHPEPQLTYPNNYYGYGEIDAYRGLLDILGIDKIESVSTSHTRALVTLRDRQLIVNLHDGTPIDSSLTLSLYSLDGRKVFRSTSLPVTIPHSIPPGIYAVQLDGSPDISGSTLIRVGR